MQDLPMASSSVNILGGDRFTFSSDPVLRTFVSFFSRTGLTCSAIKDVSSNAMAAHVAITAAAAALEVECYIVYAGARLEKDESWCDTSTVRNMCNSS